MIDLHIHTLHSDGSESVENILKMAQDAGLEMISITDHNSVKAYDDLEKCRKSFNGRIITGVEISTYCDGQSIEVLGYGVDTEKIGSFLKSVFLPHNETQLKMFDILYKRYSELGLKFDITSYDPSKEKFSRPYLCKNIIAHKENSVFCLNAGNLDNLTLFYRNEMYNPKSPLYIDFSFLNPKLEDVIDNIHKAGGLAFLAHTYIYTPDIYENIDDISARYALDGFECKYTSFTEKQSNTLIDFCNKRKLYKSGGSDFHGERRPSTTLGTGNGDLNIPMELISDWIDRVQIL